MKHTLLMLLTLTSLPSAYSATFAEQGVCTGITRAGNKIKVTLLSDYDPCAHKRAFNSLLVIEKTYKNSIPAGLTDTDYVTGQHFPEGTIGNEGVYTGLEGRKVVAKLSATEDFESMTMDFDDQEETIALECRLPQICYAACK